MFNLVYDNRTITFGNINLGYDEPKPGYTLMLSFAKSGTTWTTVAQLRSMSPNAIQATKASGGTTTELSVSDLNSTTGMGVEAYFWPEDSSSTVTIALEHSDTNVISFEILVENAMSEGAVNVTYQFINNVTQETVKTGTITVPYNTKWQPYSISLT